MKLKFHQVLGLPDEWEPDSLYFVKDGNLVRQYITGNLGVPFALAPPVQMQFAIAGMPPAGAEIGRYKATEPLSLIDVLSAASSDIAATSETVLPVMRGIQTVARFRWMPGAFEAVAEILDPAIAIDDVLIFKAPAVQDATLIGIAGTLVGLRT